MNSLRHLPVVLAVGAAVAIGPNPAALEAQEPPERIQSALDRALDAGIPTELLESKAAEGRVKGIPTDRIADAVERRLDGLSRARDALAGAGEVDATDLTVGADALEAGVSETVLETVASTAPRERRAVAIAALGHLVEQGMASDEALAAVEDALARGPAALANLPARAEGRLPIEPPAGEGGVPAWVPAPGDLPGPPDDPGPPGGQPAGVAGSF